ncbi:MAG: hypothetical protein GY847_29790 [Proteobacteria bacterium]|nr:hypothetical protein [Pseudomonadota bacterium]
MGDSFLDMISPLRAGNPSIQRDFDLMLQNNLHKRHMCILNVDFGVQAPLTLTSLADILENKFGKFNPDDSKQAQHDRAEKMRKYVAKKVHYSVVAHEIGHSISHRHNFVSSSNPMDYRSQYWQLRTKNGTVDVEEETPADNELEKCAYECVTGLDFLFCEQTRHYHKEMYCEQDDYFCCEKPGIAEDAGTDASMDADAGNE